MKVVPGWKLKANSGLLLLVSVLSDMLNVTRVELWNRSPLLIKGPSFDNRQCVSLVFVSRLDKEKPSSSSSEMQSVDTHHTHFG